MNISITEQAKAVLETIPATKIIQLAFDRGSCDIVNTIYEIKVIDNREVHAYEQLVQVDGIFLIIDEDFADTYDHELVIDYKEPNFIFKNKNQIFNNRISLRYL